MTTNKNLIVVALSCAGILGAAVLLAQNAAPKQEPAPADQQPQSSSSLDQQIKMLRQDLRSQRKQIIAQNMNLSDAEAVKFWPVYDKYVSELVESNNMKYELIKEYLRSDTLTDEQADGLAKRWLAVDENVVQLRLKYLPQFRSALPAKQTARFFQIERRVQIMIDLQLSSAVPLLEP
jgi:hypothetical protein